MYNAHRPMKQRYHYNVANTRVEQHVDKGNDDGLYISSVACCQDLWALIMDAGTGFTAQVLRFVMTLGFAEQKIGFLCCDESGLCWRTLYAVTAFPDDTPDSVKIAAARGLLEIVGARSNSQHFQHLLKRGVPAARAGLRAEQPVPAQGVDHGEVGGGLLHHRHGRLHILLLARRHVQGHGVHAAVVQGARLRSIIT